MHIRAPQLEVQAFSTVTWTQFVRVTSSKIALIKLSVSVKTTMDSPLDQGSNPGIHHLANLIVSQRKLLTKVDCHSKRLKTLALRKSEKNWSMLTRLVSIRTRAFQSLFSKTNCRRL